MRVGRSLGMHVCGVCPLMCDPYGVLDQFVAFAKRVACKLPECQEERKIRNFVRVLIRNLFFPLSPLTDVSFETWLESTHYSEARKKELRQAWEICWRTKKSKIARLKTFGKREFFIEPKVLRLINARCDVAKVIFGPYIKAVEDAVYQSPWFIKHVPVVDRPKAITDALKSFDVIMNNDFTSFESHMLPNILRIIELQLYSYMLRHVSGGERIIGLLHKILPGVNRCQTRVGRFTTLGARMSGEMCTSLGNGFTNLAIVLYLCYKKGIDDIAGFVEGDDSIFGLRGGKLTTEDFEHIGFKAKVEYTNKPGLSKFCQMVFHEDVLEPIGDPRRVLQKFGWTSSLQMHGGPKVMRQLLRAKAFSLASECPASPILRSLALAGIRLTRGVKSLYTDNWKPPVDEKKVMERLEKSTVAFESRDRMRECFGVSIDHQIELEHYLDGLKTLSPLDHPSVTSLFNQPVSYYDKYVWSYGAGEYSWAG